MSYNFRVDAHLVHVFRSDRSHFGHEMDVRHDGGIASLLPQTADDPLQILSLPTPLGRQPDDRTSGPEDAFDLPNTGFGILGVGIGHRLHGDRAVTSDHNPVRCELHGSGGAHTWSNSCPARIYYHKGSENEGRIKQTFAFYPAQTGMATVRRRRAIGQSYSPTP